MSDDDDDVDSNRFSQSSVASRERPGRGRAKKEVKYFAESGSDDDQYDMFD